MNVISIYQSSSRRLFVDRDEVFLKIKIDLFLESYFLILTNAIFRE